MTAMFAEAHPERVELAIIGGSPVGVPPEFVAPTSQVEALREGRWEQYWEAFAALDDVLNATNPYIRR